MRLSSRLPEAIHRHWLARYGNSFPRASLHILNFITQSGSLSAISWYFNLKGSIIDGVFVPISQLILCNSSLSSLLMVLVLQP